VLVSEVTEYGPAQEAGLRAGDVITALGDRRVTSKETYHAIIRDFSEGDVIPLTTWKEGRAHVIQVLSRTFPEALAEDLGYRSLGVRVQEISTALRYRFKIAARDGVVVTELREGSYLQRIGARPGDILRKLNDMMIRTVDDFKEAVVKYRQKESAVLLIQRGSQQYYVTVKADV
jgi:serine protease Do